jgi:hypothetical protein
MTTECHTHAAGNRHADSLLRGSCPLRRYDEGPRPPLSLVLDHQHAWKSTVTLVIHRFDFPVVRLRGIQALI